MCAEEFKAIIDASFDNTNYTPFWTYNSDYIFGMIPAKSDGSRWTEVSYTFEESDEPLVKNERNADLSYQFLLEELTKGVPFYVEDLNVNNIKEFAKSIESKSGPEKMVAIITELINNSNNYSKNLPIIKNQNELGKLKEKL
ncbi:MAG: hypothetical protein EU532_05915 [Promethearchaeota archaeon]|nr:MAG: hypothetical protein EU532_05915 [Candidatus Lokiarchaeota archaeon]